jgi:hypothetical protein
MSFKINLESATITSKIGRYHINIPHEERLCKICNSGDVESETHLLLSCKAYEQSRANLRSSLENASSDEINLNSLFVNSICPLNSFQYYKSFHAQIVICKSPSLSQFLLYTVCNALAIL